MTCMHHCDVNAEYYDFDAQFFILSDLHISPSLLLHFSCWLLVTCPFPPHQINDQQQLKELVLLSRNEHILITLMKKPNQGNILNRAKSFKVPFGVCKMLMLAVAGRSSFGGRMFFVTSSKYCFFFFFRSHLSSSIISSHTSKHVNRRPPIEFNPWT